MLLVVAAFVLQLSRTQRANDCVPNLPGHGHGYQDLELGCSMNGDCMYGGTPLGYYCWCSAGWMGKNCEQLDLLPAAGTGATFIAQERPLA